MLSSLMNFVGWDGQSVISPGLQPCSNAKFTFHVATKLLLCLPSIYIRFGTWKLQVQRLKQIFVIYGACIEFTTEHRRLNSQ